MSGKPKETVNYFPHMCNASEGRTLYIMEHKYGNDGYTFWFKLLELLGSTAGHAFDFSDRESWQFLVAKTRIEEGDIKDMLATLADVRAIDRELYQVGIIWSDNFVTGLTPVYQKRKGEMPERPCAGDGISGTRDHVVDTRHDISDNDERRGDPFRRIPDTGPVPDITREIEIEEEVTEVE